MVFADFFSYVPTFSKASHPEFARLLNKESKDLWLYHPDTWESQHSWCRVSMMSISAIIPARMLLEALCRDAVTDLLPTLPSTQRALGMALLLLQRWNETIFSNWPHSSIQPPMVLLRSSSSLSLAAAFVGQPASTRLKLFHQLRNCRKGEPRSALKPFSSNSGESKYPLKCVLCSSQVRFLFPFFYFFASLCLILCCVFFAFDYS